MDACGKEASRLVLLLVEEFAATLEGEKFVMLRNVVDVLDVVVHQLEALAYCLSIFPVLVASPDLAVKLIGEIRRLLALRGIQCVELHKILQAW